MKLKSGVKIGGLTPEIVVAIIVAREAYTAIGVELVVTSVKDGTHSLKSLHYAGKAIDVRTRDVPGGMRKTLQEIIAKNLGTEFDVVLETDHIHIEFDPT